MMHTWPTLSIPNLRAAALSNTSSTTESLHSGRQHPMCPSAYNHAHTLSYIDRTPLLMQMHVGCVHTDVAIRSLQS